MRILTGLALAAAALMASASAQASVIFQTDFEGPAYTPGGVLGQNGWQTFNNPAASTIDAVAPIDGAQSLKVTGSQAGGQTGAFHTDSSFIPKVTVSADIKLTNSDANRAWQFSAIGAGLVGFTGGIDIDPNGDIKAISGVFPIIGAGLFTRNVTHRVDILLDYSLQTFGVKLDGTTLASGLSFCNANAGCVGPLGTPHYTNLIFDTFGANGLDNGYLDNIRVATTVPEPATWGLMILGFGAAGAMLRRRRGMVAA